MMGMENVTFNKYGQNELASSDEGIRGIFQHPGAHLKVYFLAF